MNMRSALIPNQRITKDEADYSPGTAREHCGNCRFFIASSNGCEKVEGHILARMWCRLWKREAGGRETRP